MVLSTLTPAQEALVAGIAELVIKDGRFPSKKKVAFTLNWSAASELLDARLLTLDAGEHHLVPTGRLFAVAAHPFFVGLREKCAALLKACCTLYAHDLDRSDRWTFEEFRKGLELIDYNRDLLAEDKDFRLALAVLTRSEIPGIFSRVSNHEYPVEKFTVGAEVFDCGTDLTLYPIEPAPEPEPAIEPAPTPETPVF